MKDVNRLQKLGDLDQSKRAGFVPHANFPNARANRRHRFPVVRVPSDLHHVQGEPRTTPRILREGRQNVVRIAKETQGLGWFGHRKNI